MKILFAKVVAVGALIAVLAGAGSGADAQGYAHHYRAHGHTHPMAHQAHQRLQRLHRVYAHQINNGNRAAAERAHLRANAIRARLRAHRRYQH